MLTRWLRRSDTTSSRRPSADGSVDVVPLRTRRSAATASHASHTAHHAAHCEPDGHECPGTCPLLACGRGRGAMVVRVNCPTPDACRLRALGVYEGARVEIVDSRNGLLLNVRGSRIAIGAAVAAAIAVVPL